jgi:hypothetical protein
MWAVAFVLVVVVVVAVAVALVRRPRGDDVHSVRNYNHALGTLEHLSEQIGPPTVRPIARQVTPGVTSERVVPPVPVRGTDEFPDPDAPIVFDDARPHDRPRVGGSGDGSPSARSDRAQRMALDSMNHRRRGGTGIAIAVVVVALFAALALLGSHKARTAAHASSTTTRTTGGRGAAVTSTTRPRPPATTRPTPTTLPTQFVATTTSSAGTSATYSIPNASFQITATGTGSCWVQVASVSTGTTVWAGELSAGTVQSIQASGATTVQFGTPTLTLAVDAIPVVLPSPLRTPFTATFTPSAAAVAAAAAASAAAASAGPTTTTSASGAPTTTTSSPASTTAG